MMLHPIVRIEKTANQLEQLQNLLLCFKELCDERLGVYLNADPQEAALIACDLASRLVTHIAMIDCGVEMVGNERQRLEGILKQLSHMEVE